MSPSTRRTFRALGCLLLCLLATARLGAQESATSTPVRIRIPEEAAPALLVAASPTPTRTPTPSVVVLEARADAGPVNVRADADIESDRLGTIQAGEFYPVLGRRFRWLQIHFPSARDGRAWVFEELVTVTGDESAIPNLTLATSAAPGQADATQTRAALLRTPGAVLTMTAGARILPVPGQGEGPGGPESLGAGSSSLLPTYTYPPNLAAATATPEGTHETVTPGTGESTVPGPERIPPVTPIALLATGGLLGLMLYSLRRR